jgi:hypothetical protein
MKTCDNDLVLFREGYRLIVVENICLRTFGLRWEKLISGWEHVHRAKFNNLFSSPNAYYYVLVFTGTIFTGLIIAGAELCLSYAFKCARRMIRVDVLFTQKYHCYGPLEVFQHFIST